MPIELFDMTQMQAVIHAKNQIQTTNRNSLDKQGNAEACTECSTDIGTNPNMHNKISDISMCMSKKSYINIDTM